MARRRPGGRRPLCVAALAVRMESRARRARARLPGDGCGRHAAKPARLEYRRHGQQCAAPHSGHRAMTRLAPGVAAAALLAAVATFVSARYGGPQFLYALLFGMAFHFLLAHARTRAGIQFTARTVLRFGVGLLGARIAWEQVVALGGGPVLLVVVGVAGTIAFGVWMARLGGATAVEGLLTGGAVAICGASAALAISAVLPKTERSGHYTLITVVGVTAFSTLAMIIYPA